MTWRSIPEELLLKVNQILVDLKSYDEATLQHCLRVSYLSRFLADAAGMTSDEILQAQFAGLLHDIGKMKIPIEVLNKPGKLTDEEYHLVKRHSIFSAELLEPLVEDSFFRDIQLLVLHHHERVDGLGYPFNLQGEEIPYISRLILIVDTVDAMTHKRAYRKGLPLSVVYQELEKFAGTQFDAELVAIFIEAHKKLMDSNQVNAAIPLAARIKAA